RALELSERKGKTIHLAVAAATDRWDAMLRAAQNLGACEVVLGASPTSPVQEEARLAGLAWERLPNPKPQLTLGIYFPTGQEHVFYLGPHAPRLTPKEVDLLHTIWLDLSNALAPIELHHHDIVHVSLEELQKELSGPKRREILETLRAHLERIGEGRTRSA